MRRKFDFKLEDMLYIDNLVGQSINELRDMRDDNGDVVHESHNLTKVLKHINKHHNLDLQITPTKSFSSSKARQAKNSYDVFKSMYLKKASNYKKLRRHNYSFAPKDSTAQMLIKAAQDFFNKKK